MRHSSSIAKAATIGIALLVLSACSNLDDTQQKVLSGGAVGMGVGTVGTLITGGCVPCGTAIGGAVGAGTGYLLDQLDKSTKSGPSSSPANASYNSSSTNSSYNNSAYTNAGNRDNEPPITAAKAGGNY